MIDIQDDTTLSKAVRAIIKLDEQELRFGISPGEAERIARVVMVSMEKPADDVRDRLSLVPGGWGPGSWAAGLEAALGSQEESGED
jgi:hypothetical protein